MLKIQTHDNPIIVEYSFSEKVDARDLLALGESLVNPDNLLENHILIDTTGASIGFSLDEIRLVAGPLFKKRTRLPGARTAFVINSEVVAETVRIVRSMRKDWYSHWKFLGTRASALNWLTGESLGNVDFASEPPDPA